MQSFVRQFRRPDCARSFARSFGRRKFATNHLAAVRPQKQRTADGEASWLPMGIDEYSYSRFRPRRTNVISLRIGTCVSSYHVPFLPISFPYPLQHPSSRCQQRIFLVSPNQYNARQCIVKKKRCGLAIERISHRSVGAGRTKKSTRRKEVKMILWYVFVVSGM